MQRLVQSVVAHNKKLEAKVKELKSEKRKHKKRREKSPKKSKHDSEEYADFTQQMEKRKTKELRQKIRIFHERF